MSDEKRQRPRSPRACLPKNGSVSQKGEHSYFPRSFRPRRTTAPIPAMAFQKTRVLSQMPADVLGTMRAAMRPGFLCFEATSLPCIA